LVSLRGMGSRVDGAYRCARPIEDTTCGRRPWNRSGTRLNILLRAGFGPRKLLALPATKSDPRRWPLGVFFRALAAAADGKTNTPLERQLQVDGTAMKQEQWSTALSLSQLPPGAFLVGTWFAPKGEDANWFKTPPLPADKKQPWAGADHPAGAALAVHTSNQRVPNGRPITAPSITGLPIPHDWLDHLKLSPRKGWAALCLSF
jgi:hypothetical protein